MEGGRRRGDKDVRPGLSTCFGQREVVCGGRTRTGERVQRTSTPNCPVECFLQCRAAPASPLPVLTASHGAPAAQVWEHHPTAFNKLAVALLAAYKYEVGPILEIRGMGDAFKNRPPPTTAATTSQDGSSPGASSVPGAMAPPAAAGVGIAGGRLPPLPRPRSGGALLPSGARPPGVLKVTALLPSAVPPPQASGAAAAAGSSEGAAAARTQSPYRACEYGACMPHPTAVWNPRNVT
jgi:hypothetical protein